MLKISIITLGCPKNQIDSELMTGALNNEEKQNYVLINNNKKADVIIINTCGFIQDAKKESIETILEAATFKEEGNCKALIVTGCLTQRYKDIILEEMPEVDAILGTGTFMDIADSIEKALAGQRYKNIGSPIFNYKSNYMRNLTDTHFAYVKIAEGCNNNCTYCSIPEIRGPLNSRPLDDILQEINILVNKYNKKEIILIAQDTTQYGVDIYGKPVITELLKK